MKPPKILGGYLKNWEILTKLRGGQYRIIGGHSKK